MVLFYSAGIGKSEAVLIEDEARHCAQVLRRKVGDVIHITDGLGRFCESKIVEVTKREVLLSILSEETNNKSNRELVIALAPPKNRSRWEWFMEKSVEIGVDSILPMRTNNSERIKLNQERAEKIIRSAALQSLRKFHPRISGLQSFTDIISDKKFEEFDKYIAHFDKGNPSLLELPKKDKVLILIGPEGDFNEMEREAAKANLFIEVNISKNRLRTETAGLVALTHICNSFYI